MEMRNRVFTTIGSVDSRNELVHADPSVLLRRLLLFDQVVIQSNGLREFPILVDSFGFDGVRALLEGEAIAIYLPESTVAQVGQSEVRQKSALPQLSYCFWIAKQANRAKFLEDRLRNVESIDSLDAKKRSRLIELLESKILEPPENEGVRSGEQTVQDLAGNIPAVKIAVARAVSRRYSTTVQPDDFHFRLIRIGDDEFSADTNLHKTYALSKREAHELIGGALLAVGGVNVRLEQMETYQAVHGSTKDDLPIVESKLDFLYQQLAPEGLEQQFLRVVELDGLPAMSVTETPIDVSRLLEVRGTDECAEFRQWLREISDLPDDEVRARVKSIRARLAADYNTAPSKVARFLTSLGLSFIPGVGAVASAGLSALDEFVLERVFAESGPVSFLSQLYPSIFEGR